MAKTEQQYIQLAADLNKNFGNIYRAFGNGCGIVVIPKCKMSIPHALVFLENCPTFKGITSLQFTTEDGNVYIH